MERKTLTLNKQDVDNSNTSNTSEKLPLEIALEEAARQEAREREVDAKASQDAMPKNEPQNEDAPVFQEEDKGPKHFDTRQYRKNNPPPKYLRSTPPTRSTITLLPKPEPEDDNATYSSKPEPINSSVNETMAGIARADRASSRAYSQAPRATRSSRAASSAGMDLSEDIRSKGKFRQSVQQVRNAHPFLLERPLNITDEDANKLIEKIRAVPLYKMQDLSIDLNSEETKSLFHALLLVDDSKTIRAIQHLAVQRASWSLYTIGWSTLQRNFPNRWVQQTLELVFNTLESDPTRSEVRPSYMHMAIGDLVNLSKSDSSLVTDVVRHLNQAYNVSPDEGIETMLRDYQIIIETAFGGAIFAEFFRRADYPVLYYKRDILVATLAYMHPALAAEVVSRIISSRDPIEGDKKFLYKQIADIFIHKEARHPMWPYMSNDLQRNYKRWYIDDRIVAQTDMYPAKKEFINTYIEDIEDIAMVSNDIMAIRFDRFIIIDDRKRGDGLTYYDNESVKELLLQGLDEKDLGSSSIPSIDVKEAVNSKHSNGVVRLSFSPGKFQYSRHFMDLALGHTKQKHDSSIRNWFR